MQPLVEMRSLDNRECVSVRERLDVPALDHSIFSPQRVISSTSVELGTLKQADFKFT